MAMGIDEAGQPAYITFMRTMGSASATASYYFYFSPSICGCGPPA
jgi:hypothetical protein